MPSEHLYFASSVGPRVRHARRTNDRDGRAINDRRIKTQAPNQPHPRPIRFPLHPRPHPSKSFAPAAVPIRSQAGAPTDLEPASPTTPLEAHQITPPGSRFGGAQTRGSSAALSRAPPDRAYRVHARRCERAKRRERACPSERSDASEPVRASEATRASLSERAKRRRAPTTVRGRAFRATRCPGPGSPVPRCSARQTAATSRCGSTDPRRHRR